MSIDDGYFRREHFHGAIAPGPISEEEITPLLEAMDDTRIGISTQTLVSNTGSGVEPKRLRQYIAALAVTLGAFSLGNVLSWTSPANGQLSSDYSDSDKSWIGSAMALGAAVAVVPGGLIMDGVGRKKCMLLLVLPFVAGWLIIIFSNSVWMYIIGRFITGMLGGAFSVTAPTYTSEIADNKVRGMLGSFFQLMVTVGILFVYILGGVELDLVVISGICAAVPIVFGVIFVFMPETPIQLLKNGKEEEARKSLQWFRGPYYDIEEEIQASKETLAKIEREKLSFMQSFSSKAAKKALFIASGLMLFQQLSGVNAIIFYASDIFLAAGSTLDPNICSIIVGAVQVVATFVASQIVDRLGRRILLLLSDCVMSICCILLGIFFYMKNNNDPALDSITWLPLVSLCLFLIVFSLGYGPIPWMMVGELFPQSIKGAATSVSCMLNWIIAFLVTKFFSDVATGLGRDVTFWIFAGVSAVGTIFVFIFVPETKGKSFAEIQRELGDETAPVNSNVPEKF